MRAIKKGPEPRSLKQHRCSSFADFDNYPKSDELRASLVAEQKGICCYCMNRIAPTEDSMKIEHWHCQRRYSSEQLDYINLLGSCKGNEGEPRSEQHCDSRKRDLDLTLNPADPTHNIEIYIRYSPNGEIFSDDATIDDELNRVLNLNHPFLVENRKAVLDGFKRSLPQGTLKKTFINRKLVEWSQPSGGHLRTYCMAVVYWLRMFP